MFNFFNKKNIPKEENNDKSVISSSVNEEEIIDDIMLEEKEIEEIMDELILEAQSTEENMIEEKEEIKEEVNYLNTNIMEDTEMAMNIMADGNTSHGPFKCYITGEDFQIPHRVVMANMIKYPDFRTDDMDIVSMNQTIVYFKQQNVKYMDTVTYEEPGGVIKTYEAELKAVLFTVTLAFDILLTNQAKNKIYGGTDDYMTFEYLHKIVKPDDYVPDYNPSNLAFDIITTHEHLPNPAIDPLAPKTYEFEKYEVRGYVDVTVTEPTPAP